MIRLLALVAILSSSVACGEDEGAPPPKTGGAAPVPPAAPKPAGTVGKQLSPMKQIEQRVQCPSPTPAKVCDPKLSSSCAVEEGQPKQYCLETTKGWFCGPCSERDTIRQALRPRDFAPETIRDPFVSTFIAQPGGTVAGTTTLPKDVTKRCGDDSQVRLASYSFLDLKLVGVIKLGLQRKLLMLDPVNVGHVIARNECIGKERAYVKDIGEEPGVPSRGILGRGIFVTFEIPPDPTQSETRPPEERTIYLNPNARIGAGTAPPSDTRPVDPTTPVVGPGAAPPSGSAAPPAPPPPVVAPPR